jgi:CHAT domain-containing protein
MGRAACHLFALLSALFILAARPSGAQAAHPLCMTVQDAADREVCEARCQSAPPADPLCLHAVRFGNVADVALSRYRQDRDYARVLAAIPTSQRKLWAWYAAEEGLAVDPADVPRPQPDRATRSRALAWERCSAQLRAEAYEDALRCTLEFMHEVRKAGQTREELDWLMRGAGQVEALRGEVQAAGLYEDAAKLAARLFPAGHPRRVEVEGMRASSQITLGGAGRIQALEALDRAVQESEAVFGALHVRMVMWRLRLATGALYAGQLERAERAFAEALRVSLLVLGPEHPQTALVHFGRAAVQAELSDWDGARAGLERAAAIYGARGDGYRLSYVLVAADLGWLELAAGRVQQAERWLEEAWRGAQALPQLSDKHRAMVWERRAQGMVAVGAHAEAAALFGQVRALRLGIYGERHVFIASGLREQARALVASGAAQEAVALFEQALAIDEALWGVGSQRAGEDLAELAALLWRLGRMDEARAAQRRALESAWTHYQRSAGATRDDLQLLGFLGTMRERVALTLEMSAGEADQGEVFEALARWMGAGLELERLRKRQREALARMRPEAQRVWQQVLDLEAQRAQALDAGDGARAQVLEQERVALLKREPAVRALRELGQGTFDMAALCAAARRADAAIVVYARYARLRQEGAAYTALVWSGVGREGCALERVELGAASEVEGLITAWDKALGEAERCYGSRGKAALCGRELAGLDGAGRALHDRVWAPVWGRVSGVKRVWVALDGELWRVPLDALWTGEQYVVEQVEVTALTRVGAALEAGKVRRGKAGRAVVVGDLDYGEAVDEAQALASWERCGVKGCRAALPERPKGVAGLRGGDVCGFEAIWGRLVTEARGVAERLGAVGLDVLLVTGQGALVSLLGEALRGASVVHVATHGFFARGGECAQRARVRREGPGELSWMVYDPLRLSALVVSGANLGVGAWSARAIAGLSLEPGALVVLSACETGRGEVAQGEGALGLIRAFQIAGAGEVIGSLWQVPSAPTGALFEDFYREGGAQGAAARLRAAKLEALKRSRQEGVAHSSFLWGAFMLVH